MDRGSTNTWEQAFRYVYCYLLWLAASAFSGWLVLELRINMIDLAAFFGLDPWAFPAVHNFGFVILALIWLSFVIFVEDYLRRGVDRGDLFRRALRIFNGVLVLLVMSYALQRILLV